MYDVMGVENVRGKAAWPGAMFSPVTVVEVGLV